MVDVEQLSSFKAMRKADEFRITFGEYMDWQRLIYAQLPPIDIFNFASRNFEFLKEQFLKTQDSNRASSS